MTSLERPQDPPPAAPARIIPIHPAQPEAASLFEKHRKVYPRAVQGRFAAWRWCLVWVTQAVFYGLPWLSWNGRPAVLFDLSARRFYLFDLVLYPQDFIYLTGLLVVSALGLFFFTAIAGRLWCGYACPQTVYTEIFLWIEQRIEGQRGARLKRDAAPWTGSKLARKSAKHAIWLSIALWTGFSFVGYFTPIRELWAQAFSLSFGPWEWFWVNFYGLATYGNAGFLREQVCKTMCPYARFQGAMFDDDTLVISYDPGRGEPRGKRGRSTDLREAGLGHCIDCDLCVQVCPVGIDIRDGLQCECIACAACIDACDGVMDKLRYPRGLVRYATQRGLAGEGRGARLLRPRVLVYGGLLSLALAALLSGLWLRDTLKVDVVRDRATLARMVGQGNIENVYRLQLMNATERSQSYHLSVQGLEGVEFAHDIPDVEVGPAQARWLSVTVRMPHPSARTLGPGVHPMQFTVSPADGHAAVTEKSTFVIPR
jgi:cytochrome c oxidase accessory protein FixG